MCRRIDFFMPTTILCLKLIYLDMLRKAQETDSSIRYRHLRTDPNLSLLFNTTTRECKFGTKLEARTERLNDFLEVFPWINFAATRKENLANLRLYGWPDYDSEGV